ncbi:helix-turn-helix transcriptional regulator [Actinokineospora sp. HUAS TT18]|uniref:helix-turn-helix transcriptional regulator n=1 Tax=Actinokineospora sp. HUAS TT18 TaxID=3447451 RepID=UPI003F51D1B7
MTDTSARLLRLLSLLQARRTWTGPELAERLDVTTRTIRNDVERLRGLGYPVDATPGVSGGYTLGAGAAMPPLLLDDEEAVAIVVGLRTAAGGGVAGMEETSVRALAKLEQVLPSRLRHRVEALQTSTVAVQTTGPTVDPHVLTTLASACRDRETLRFDYVGHNGSESRRQAEPHRLVHMGRRWYLVAWDVDRRDWRTFRVDRVHPRTPNGRRFAPRNPPEGGVVEYLQRGVGAALWRHHATIRLHAPASAVAAKVPPAVVVEAVDDHHCLLKAGADTLEYLALYLGLLDVDFDVVDSPEFAEHLRKLIGRFGRAVDDR